MVLNDDRASVVAGLRALRALLAVAHACRRVAVRSAVGVAEAARVAVATPVRLSPTFTAVAPVVAVRIWVSLVRPHHVIHSPAGSGVVATHPVVRARVPVALAPTAVQRVRGRQATLGLIGTVTEAHAGATGFGILLRTTALALIHADILAGAVCGALVLAWHVAHLVSTLDVIVEAMLCSIKITIHVRHGVPTSTLTACGIVSQVPGKRRHPHQPTGARVNDFVTGHPVGLLRALNAFPKVTHVIHGFAVVVALSAGIITDLDTVILCAETLISLGPKRARTVANRLGGARRGEHPLTGDTGTDVTEAAINVFEGVATKAHTFLIGKVNALLAI